MPCARKNTFAQEQDSLAEGFPLETLGTPKLQRVASVSELKTRLPDAVRSLNDRHQRYLQGKR